MAAITTDDQLTSEIGKLAGTPLPGVAPVTTTVGAGEDISATSGQIGVTPDLTASQVSETGLTPATPTAPAADVGQVAGITGIRTDRAG
jgi:enamine deaminase RidA (YjgF/YER057c/UK114 family)